MENEDLRVILVGAGGFGQVWWDLNQAGLGARVVAVVDVTTDALTRSAQSLGLGPEQQFASLEDALGAVEADAVIDSTPPAFHLTHALQCFEAGLHLFTAKPMAERWEDAVRIVTEAESRSLLVAVNEQLRLGWLPLAIANVLQSGELGPVESVQVAFREHSNWTGWRAAMDDPLLLDAAIQHFDMVRAVTGLEVESAYCLAWKRERSTYVGAGSASALLRLTGEVPLSYTGTWEHGRDRNDCTGWWGEWRIQCARGELRAEGKRGLWVNNASSPVVVENLDVRRLSHLLFDQFVRGVRTGATVPTDGWNDLRTYAFSELCIRSARTGFPARVEELNPPLSRTAEYGG